ncbi:hypothetical protein [Streptomyces lavendulae]
MHRTKPFRARVLVPSALAVVILSGAAAPAGAADGSGAAVTERVASVQRQVERIEERVAAGPVDDLLAGLTKTLEDLLKSLTALLPAGVNLPPIQLPKLPALPDIPGLPDLKLPAVELPKLPVTVPALPATPAVPPVDGLVPAIPAIPAIPDIPLRN